MSTTESTPAAATTAVATTHDPESGALDRRRPRPAFRVLVVGVAIAGLPLYVFGLAEIALMWLSDARLLETIDDLAAGDLAFRAQFFHLGIVAWALFPPLLAQLWRPERRVAPALQGASVALAAALAMVASGALGLVDVGLVAVFGGVALLHPCRSAIVRRPRLDPLQAKVAGVGAAGWLAVAGWYVSRAWDGRGAPGAADVEAHGLWATSAAMALALAVVGLTGATDHRGWQLPAVTAAAGSVLVGAHALVHADQAASIGAAGAVLAFAWGAIYGAAIMRRLSRRDVA